MGEIMSTFLNRRPLVSSLALAVGLTFAAAAAAAPALAQDREAELEQRLKELEQKVQMLEEMLATQAVEPAAGEADKDAVKVTMKGPAPTFESADGNYSLSISGRVHSDFAVYDQDPVPTGAQDARIDPDLNSGSLIRRARLGVEGKIAGDWVYELFFDLGGNASRVYSAYMAYKGIKPLTIAIGKHKAPTGMEEMTSSNDITFLERSLPSNVATDVGASRRLGLSVQANGDAWYAGVGVFGADPIRTTPRTNSTSPIGRKSESMARAGSAVPARRSSPTTMPGCTPPSSPANTDRFGRRRNISASA